MGVLAMGEGITFPPWTFFFSCLLISYAIALLVLFYNVHREIKYLHLHIVLSITVTIR